MWNPNESELPPPSFMNILFGGDESDDDDDNVVDDDDVLSLLEYGAENAVGDEEFLDCLDDVEIDPVDRDSSPTPPPYSPLSRAVTPEPSTAAVGKIFIFDQDGTQVGEIDASDSHALYESTEDFYVVGDSGIGERDRGNSRRRSLRGRVRGGREGRGRTRGQGHRGHRLCRQRWQPGQPLEEIWTTDDDVPLELRVMARDVMRRRQARVERDARMRERANERALLEDQNSASEDDEVFVDAIDGRGNTLLKGADLHFEWSPMETFRNVEETFVPERTGSVSSYENPYDAFRSFWDDDILQNIVEETNRYASQIKSAAFQAAWYPINVHELMCLFAFWMMSGIIRMPTIKSYFSTNSLLGTEVFSLITTRSRYNNICRALHLADTSQTESANPTSSGAAALDPMHRLRPIIDHLNSKFKSNYVLSKDICIDESLTLWKGRLKFKQYIRSKAAKFGIKTFELCESATGYLWSFVVYTGKTDAVQDGMPKSTAIVLDLIRPLLNKGYRLFMDNWFNSPVLARILKRNGTDCVGTLRACRSDVPRVVTHAPLQQGQLVARHSGDVCVLSWMDKKKITMISTCHGSETGLSQVLSRPSSRPELFKPQSILDYNRCMGGVDRKDQMLEPYLLERKKCAKWYLKLFKRLVNCSIHNACILLESSLQAHQNTLNFRLQLVHSILSVHLPLIPRQRTHRAPKLPLHPQPSSSSSSSLPMDHGHWPVHVPQTALDASRKTASRRKCVVCISEGRKNHKTPYMCEYCVVPLCVEPCFKKYHVHRDRY